MAGQNDEDDMEPMPETTGEDDMSPLPNVDNSLNVGKGASDANGSLQLLGAGQPYRSTM